jgi:hypothetical protein
MEWIGGGKLLTIIGMVAMSIVFLFSTFETRDAAQDEKKNETSSMEQLNHKLDRIENKIDHFLESRKR